VCWYRGGDADESSQATVDWSWGTVRYRLGTGSTDDAESHDDVVTDNNDESVSSPQPTDVQPPLHSTPLQVTHYDLHCS